MTQKFGSVTYQHAEWLSKNRMADPVTGCDSDGFLFSALTGGFHANFDSSVIEAPLDGTGVMEDVVTTIGDLIVCDSTANDTVTRLANGGAGTIFVGTTGAVPKYLAAGSAGQSLISAGAADPVWQTRDINGTTGTGGTVGQIAVVGMHANGAVVATALEDLGVGLVISDVVCGVDLVTVYTRDVLSVGDARAALDSKKVAIHVVDFGS